MSDPIKNLRNPMESLAQGLPDGGGLLNDGLRCLVAGIVGSVPFGGTLTEAMAIAREKAFEREFSLFRVEVDSLEERVGSIQNADAFLESSVGQEHVARILKALEHRQGLDHRSALASAFVSGIGHGRFQGNVVLMFDETLARLNSLHTQVLRWAYSERLGQPFKERFDKALRVVDLVNATGHPTALLQKVTSDLAQAGLVVDTSINSVGAHYGTFFFALTSFGASLARYIAEPSAFTGERPAQLEEPFPQASGEQ